jgi:heme oxygenase
VHARAPSRPPLLLRLREATAPLHAEAEGAALVRGVLGPGGTEVDYRHYLARLLGVHAPLEAALGAHAALAHAGFDAGARRKVPLLEADLCALGLSSAQVDALPRCARVPDVTPLGRALGCAYVLEGSTLGGQYLLRQLRPRLPHLEGRATAFLAGYGPRTGPLWRDFLAVLEGAPLGEAGRQQAVDAACETFTALTEWMQG